MTNFKTRKKDGQAFPTSDGKQHRRKDDYRGNSLPPKNSNWYNFANSFDMGVLDLDHFASQMDYHDFDDLDISISPKSLYNKNNEKFVDAVEASSAKAQEMDEDQIEAMIKEEKYYVRSTLQHHYVKDTKSNKIIGTYTTRQVAHNHASDFNKRDG